MREDDIYKIILNQFDTVFSGIVFRMKIRANTDMI